MLDDPRSEFRYLQDLPDDIEAGAPYASQLSPYTANGPCRIS